MKIETHVVDSLGGYMDKIREIAMVKGKGQNKDFVPVLWFRGQSDIGHSLMTTLHRSGVVVDRHGDIRNYSQAHYDEDMCAQHYIAKNYHYFEKVPDSRVEWLEVMQHHGMRTRLLDWSESSIHSLMFSLECFLDKKNYRDTDRNKCTPCVWILDPVRLNKRIYEILQAELQKKIEAEDNLIVGLLDELELSDNERSRTYENIKKIAESGFLKHGENHLEGIFNLSEINNEILRDRSRLKYMLREGDNFNPFFYLYSRIYSDGYVLKDRKFPPLATVQSYHSERIKAQRGVFTVFPFYDETLDASGIRKVNINPDALENNIYARDFLERIVISSPQKVAYELLANGMDDSWLYPEMPIVSNVLENRRVFA
ncbi:MAG: FRG domain-containing protein [Roseburia sp.]|nr:FRG domain-containing protein [Roseburia sp.]